jgi:hypothetical protein
MNSLQAIWQKGRWPLSFVMVIGSLLAIIAWGGMVQPEPRFYLGVGVIILLVVGFVGLSWWLYFSPISEDARKSAGRTRGLPSVLVILITAGSLISLIGAFWDEVWHRTYGVPIGEDLLWAPHMLIYVNFTLISLWAGLGIALAVRGKGDLRARFRQEQVMTLLALSAAFTVMCVPFDPMWHALYGVDIAAWSLPHVLLAFGVGAVPLFCMGATLAFVRRTHWGDRKRIGFAEFLVMIQVMCFITSIGQILLTDWDNVMVTNAPVPAFWERPQWLYPTIAATIFFFAGSAALHAVRRVGFLTLTAVMMLVVRVFLMTLFDSAKVGMEYNTLALTFIAFISLDVVYALRRGASNTWQGEAISRALAVILFIGIGLFYINARMVYPKVNAETLPGMVVMTFVYGMFFSWLGARIGNWMGHTAEQTQEASPRQFTLKDLRFGGLAVVATALIVVFFMATANPPASMISTMLTK